MPKIGVHKLRVFHADGERRFDVTLNYSNSVFWAAIPSEFTETCQTLDAGIRKKMGITTDRSAARMSVTDIQKWRIETNTEEALIKVMEHVVDQLLSMTIKQRKVIIVFFNKHRKTQYNSLRHNPQHEQKGFVFALTYAIENSVEGSKRYATYKEREMLSGEIKTEREDISLYPESCTIIDDTPENREFLEGLYHKVSELQNNLSKFLGNDENLLQLIASNQRLLG